MHKHEQRILEALLNNLRAAGYEPAAIWTEEYYLTAVGDKVFAEFAHSQAPELIERPLTNAEVVKAFEEYDMYAPTIHFTDRSARTWSLGVMVVPGNLEDFISDWHVRDDAPAFDKIVGEVASAAGEGAFE